MFKSLSKGYVKYRYLSLISKMYHKPSLKYLKKLDKARTKYLQSLDS